MSLDPPTFLHRSTPLAVHRYVGGGGGVGGATMFYCGVRCHLVIEIKKNRKYFKAQLYGTYEVLLFHVHSILISWRLWHHTLICGYVAHYSCWRFHGPCSRPVNTGVQKFFFARSDREFLPSTFKVVVGLSCRLTKLNVCLASPLCWRDRRPADRRTDTRAMQYAYCWTRPP